MASHRDDDDDDGQYHNYPYGLPDPPHRRESNSSNRSSQPLPPPVPPRPHALYNNENGEQQQMADYGQPYRANSNARRQNDELFMGGGGHAGPGRIPYQANPAAQPPLPPLPTNHTYNPQEYYHSQFQRNPPTYNQSPTINSPVVHSPSPNNAYRPYIPAAYQATNAYSPNQAPIPFPVPYGNSPVTPQDASQSPHMSLRPYEQPHATQRVTTQLSAASPTYGAPTDAAHRQSQPLQHNNAPLPPLPPRPTLYTPPAPPPPPFSPGTDAFPSATPLRGYVHSNDTSRPAFSSGSRQSSLNHLPTLPVFQGEISPFTSPSLLSRPSVSPALSGGAISPGAVSGPSTPGPTPPAHLPQRSDTNGRHPQSRPLPGPPSDNYATDYFEYASGGGGETLGNRPNQDEVIKELEDEIMGRTASNASRQGNSPRAERINYRDPINEEEESPPLRSHQGSFLDITPDTIYTHTSRNGVRTSTAPDTTTSAYDDSSDLEAEAGLEAMRMAEEQENTFNFTHSSSVSRDHGSQRQSQQARTDEGTSSGSELIGAVGEYAGAIPSNYDFHYGTTASLSSPQAPGQGYLDGGLNGTYGSNEASGRGSAVSSEHLEMPPGNYGYSASDDAIHPFPSFGARVDSGGTGGLAEPGLHMRRLSFEDYPDEATLVEYDTENHSSETSSLRTGGSIRDQYPPNSPYHSRTSSRPLPRLPSDASHDAQTQRRSVDQFGRPIYPQAPDEYEQGYTASGIPVKANSIGSHSTTPHVLPPGRSVTDAEQRRKQHLAGIRTNVHYDQAAINSGGGAAASLKLGAIDLPSIPVGRRKKFVPSKLSTVDFAKCPEPWALSSILAWVRLMTEGETDLKEQPIVDSIINLFTHKVPTMNVAEAESLSARVVQRMKQAGALIREEEWVKFGNTDFTGVVFQLTGVGCYSSKVHVHHTPGRCYSHHCMRTLKKVALQTQRLVPKRDDISWAVFYHLSKDDVEGKDRKELEKQNNLHEMVTTEEKFMDDLNVMRLLYRDGLLSSHETIMSRKKLDSLVKNVFGNLDAIQSVNENYLLAPMKYRQQEQGPWILGFSEFFREWIRKAKQVFVDYAAAFPAALVMMKKERDGNLLFRQFLDQVRENESSKRLDWDHYLKTPITRLQRYSLLLGVVLKHMIQDSEEKINLQVAIDEIKAVTLECDAKVAEMSRKSDLIELGNKLKLRPEMDKVKLNLSHLGREIIHQGDLLRKGNNRVTWLDTHAVLFDHYLVLAKPFQQRDAAGGIKNEFFDVSKLPIPMDLLVLESTLDDPVPKNTVKNMTGVVSGANIRSPRDQYTRATSTPVDSSRPTNTLTHTATNTSVTSTSTSRSSAGITATTILDAAGNANERLLYPFKVKHLGKADVYTLYAANPPTRQEWCDRIVAAKTRHAASLFAQNAEPFRLRVMADTAFAAAEASSAGGGGGGGGGQSRPTPIRGTPVDRACREIEKLEGATAWLPPVCRAQVNCATAFNQPMGHPMVAVGTDYGVFVTEYNNPRGWRRAIIASKVTQISVLEEFSIFLLISDRALIAHHLDTIVPAIANSSTTSSNPGTSASDNTSLKRAPQKLSGSRDVGFFATGRMKDRTLVFYKKRDGISSTFKVLEPVYQRSSSSGGSSTRGRFGLRRGQTDYFRDFDDFYIPSQTFALNLFEKSLAVATEKGFEILTLDKKLPLSIPDLKPAATAPIAARVRDQRPLGMFRLSDVEFLLVFEEVGIYVNKHGDVSRSVVLEFVGRAKQAVLHGGTYLVLVDKDGGFVEVRNAIDGRLRQVIAGRDVRLLDTGVGSVGGGLGGYGGGTVKVAMQHPEMERSQVVLELVVREGVRE